MKKTIVSIGILIAAGLAALFFLHKEPDVPKSVKRPSEPRKETVANTAETLKKKEKKTVHVKPSKPPKREYRLSNADPAKVFSDIETIAEKMKFKNSYVKEIGVSETLSTKGCPISRKTYGLCVKCHGKYGENVPSKNSAPLAVMSARVIFDKIDKCPFAKELNLSVCDKKFLANQIKGL
jgi:cytochrome c553